jgi:hypothetical protein
MVSAKRTAAFGRARWTVGLTPFSVDSENEQRQFSGTLPERLPGA